MSIVVYCPGCKTRLTVGDDRAHDQFECPNCDELIRVWALTQTQPAAEPEPELAFDDRPTRSQRSSRDFEDDYDDDEDDRPRRRSRRRRGGCPYCGSDEPPEYSSRISQGGWITFAILLLFCWPLCFIGLFMKEDYPICYECGRALG